jgi:hypothetical protein
MAKKIIKETVVLQRDGKRVVPEINKLFELTDDEIKSITAVRPQAISDVEVPETDPKSDETQKAAPTGKGGKGSTKSGSDDL